MGNHPERAKSLKSKIQAYIGRHNQVSFGELKKEFCADNKLMSHRTFVKYLNELVDEERILRIPDKDSQKVFYSEDSTYRLMENVNKWHYEYLKSIKTLEEAKKYCETLWLMYNVVRNPQSRSVKNFVRQIKKQIAKR